MAPHEAPGGSDEAAGVGRYFMPVTHHPVWSDKAALARLAEAGARLEGAQAAGCPQLSPAERDSQDALKVYEALRERLAQPEPGRDKEPSNDMGS